VLTLLGECLEASKVPLFYNIHIHVYTYSCMLKRQAVLECKPNHETHTTGRGDKVQTAITISISLPVAIQALEE
jgi:hypothetical protein